MTMTEARKRLEACGYKLGLMMHDLSEPGWRAFANSTKKTIVVVRRTRSEALAALVAEAEVGHG
jgi:hypothetical protein